MFRKDYVQRETPDGDTTGSPRGTRVIGRVSPAEISRTKCRRPNQPGKLMRGWIRGSASKAQSSSSVVDPTETPAIVIAFGRRALLYRQYQCRGGGVTGRGFHANAARQFPLQNDCFLDFNFWNFKNHSFPTWIPLLMCTTPSGSSSICRAQIAILSIEKLVVSPSKLVICSTTTKALLDHHLRTCLNPHAVRCVLLQDNHNHNRAPTWL